MVDGCSPLIGVVCTFIDKDSDVDGYEVKIKIKKI